MLAGFLSLSFIAGRAPVISEWIADPHWIKRVLVVHVNLALLVFIYAYFCGLFTLIPRNNGATRLPLLGFAMAIVGVGMLVVTIFVSSADPVLSNYIPVLDHPLFIGSLLVFGCGVALTVLNSRTLTKPEIQNKILPISAVPGLQSAAIILLLSLITFIASWAVTPIGTNPQAYYERVIWGGGHLLQFVNMAALASVWFILLGRLLGQNPLSYKWSAILFGLFTLPLLAAPLLTLSGTDNALYITGFTRYMQWGIFPAISIFIIIIVIILVRARLNNALPSKLSGNPYFIGLAVSMVFIGIGFMLGAMIRGSNTMVPAHYHAALGGITVAFMAVTYLLLDKYGMPLRGESLKKKAAFQPLLFGLGQALFVAGFAYAGAYGLARKSFGADQHIGSIEAYIGLVVAGTGGLLAIAGGLLFFWIVIKAWRNRKVPKQNADFKSE